MQSIFTIGHSTRSADEFIGLLAAHEVNCLADVRTVPRSRRNPQFNRDTLPGTLREAGIDYVHMRGLGGFRRPRPDSVNAAWRNESFRGYADYMQTPEFAEHLEALLARAATERIAIMCAEAVPWRCHRSLIADALLVRGIEVFEIIDAKHVQPHELTKFAKVEGTRVTYPAGSS